MENNSEKRFEFTFKVKKAFVIDNDKYNKNKGKEQELIALIEKALEMEDENVGALVDGLITFYYTVDSYYHRCDNRFINCIYSLAKYDCLIPYVAAYLERYDNPGGNITIFCMSDDDVKYAFAVLQATIETETLPNINEPGVKNLHKYWLESRNLYRAVDVANKVSVGYWYNKEEVDKIKNRVKEILETNRYVNDILDKQCLLPEALHKFHELLYNLEPKYGETTLYENEYLYIVTIDDAVYEKHKKKINHLVYDIMCNYNLEKDFACFPRKFLSKWDKPIPLKNC